MLSSLWNFYIIFGDFWQNQIIYEAKFCITLAAKRTSYNQEDNILFF
jgi:hypothetical protein